jgi:hypothetical protein
MLPSSVDRVARLTAPEVNARIRRETVRTLARYRGAPRAAIELRLEALDREWDIDRAIEANAGSIALAGIALGTFVNRRFLLLSAAAGVFLLQHALQGWCPLVPIMRRFSFRTPHEIEAERRVLRHMRSLSS